MTWIEDKKPNDVVPQTCIMEYQKIYKISYKIINFVTEAIKNWKVELTARGKTLTVLSIQGGILQGDALSPLLFVTAIMPLNYALRKCNRDYQFTKLPENINHLMYMDDIKRSAKKEKELETDTNHITIQPGYRNGVWHRKMYHAHNEKWKNANNRRNRNAKSIKKSECPEKKKITSI